MVQLGNSAKVYSDSNETSLVRSSRELCVEESDLKPTFCQCCERKYLEPDDYLTGTSRFRVCSKGNLWFECSCGSGLILKKGDYEWYSPSLKMSDAAATVFQDVKEIKNIPLIPTAVIELQGIISDENASSKDIEVALRKAPNIALSVIRTANGLRTSSAAQINSLQHAVTYIGRQMLNDLILAESLQEFDFKTNFFSKDSFWEEAYVTGKAAEYLAEHFAPEVSKDEAYLAGSLCNVGKIVSAICFPEMTDDIARATANPRRPVRWDEAENQLRAISHVVLGEIAAAMWGFPEYIVHALFNHHQLPRRVADLVDNDCAFLDDDDESSEQPRTLQQVIALANQYTHWVLLQPNRMNESLFNDYAAIFGFDDKQKEDIGEYLLESFKKQFQKAQ